MITTNQRPYVGAYDEELDRGVRFPWRPIVRDG